MSRADPWGFLLPTPILPGNVEQMRIPMGFYDNISRKGQIFGMFQKKRLQWSSKN
jgi:hypothetical protein